MTYKLSIENKTEFLHAVVSGENTKENVVGYLAELLQECQAQDCYRLLIEERLEGPRLGTFEVFEIASLGSEQSSGIIKAIAYVDVNARDDLMGFAENVAVNRAVPVKVFSSVSDAEKWLQAGD